MNLSKKTHRYDVAVIGSGLGGLVSGLLLAKAGKKVCIIEKNNQLGGNLQTFSRDKKILDTGVHYIGGLEEGQNLYKYFKQLDILDDLEWEKMNSNHFDKIYFDESKIYYPQAQGYQSFIDELLKYFPDEKQAIETYIQTIQEYCNAFPMYDLDFESTYQSNYLESSVQEVLNAITPNEKLQSVWLGNSFLYALDYTTTPFYIHALTVNSYIQSSWRCIKGGSQLTKALLKQLRKYDVAIFKHQEVIGFEMQDKCIAACYTETDCFYADEFISNINLKTTFSYLPVDLQQKPSIQRIKQLKVTPSVFSVHFILNEHHLPYFDYNIYHYDTYEDVRLNKWLNPLVITTNPSKPSQKYAETITVMTYANIKDFESWKDTFNTVNQPNTRSFTYEQYKDFWVKHIIDKMEKHFPNFREAIKSYYTSTPLTYRDYIGLEDGNMYGFQKQAHQSALTQIFPRTKVNNLFLVGQNVRLHGILGVTISAFHLAKEYLGTERFLDIIKTEQS